MSNADFFLKKTLGEDFLESLAKVELWKPGTKSTIDHEELRSALQIVPRTVMALRIRELAPMTVGENKVVNLFVASNATMNVTKHERDVYSGEITEGSKKVVEFTLRALPGVGLVIMSAFELYDMDNLINSPNPQMPVAAPIENADVKIQRLIDDRLELHSLIGKVVEKKIMEREAIHQLVLGKLTEAICLASKEAQDAKVTADFPHDRIKSVEQKVIIADVKADTARVIAVQATKRSRPVQEFLAKRKPKQEFSIQLAKGESVECPDCRKNIFDGKVFSACICYGDDRDKKLFIKKSEDGINVRFGRGWDPENMEMLLEVLQKKK